jgi:murein peptide amidase A
VRAQFTNGPVLLPAPPPAHVEVIGRSVGGRPIRAIELRGGSRVVLVVGCIHGNETAGIPVVQLLERRAVAGVDLWLVPDLNPDGVARGTRQNAHGVDLNRNFPAMWLPIGRRGSPQWSGPRPLSEPESRAARNLIRRIHPRLTLWFHQPQALVRAWGPSRAAGRRFARLAAMRYRSLPWPNGSAPNWQNHLDPHSPSFVVELPAGPLTAARAGALARAVREAAS